jgi:hypothetical protein
LWLADHAFIAETAWRRKMSAEPLAGGLMQHKSGRSVDHRRWRSSRCGWHRTVAASLMVLAAPSLRAAAQDADRPLLLPKRGVAVEYQVTDPHLTDGAQKLLVTYASGGDRTRVDYFRLREAKYPYASVIFDRAADHVLAVLPERRSYVERQVGKTGNPGMFLKPAMRFTRQGKATIAGLECTEWKIRPPASDQDGGSACVTDDGVALRLTSAGNSQLSLVATVVAYGAPPEGVFVPPPDFSREVPR